MRRILEFEGRKLSTGNFLWHKGYISYSVMHKDTPTAPDPQKNFWKRRLDPTPQPVENLNFIFTFAILNSLQSDFSIEIEVKNAKLVQISISLYYFLKIFSYLMFYDSALLFYITESNARFLICSGWNSESAE